MLAHLADVSIRSLLLVLPAGLALWLLRCRRTAALQHAVWTAVLCGMLALFAFGQVLPRLSLRILERPAAAAPDAPPAVLDTPALSFETPAAQSSPSPATLRRPVEWTAVAAYAYGAIAFGFLAQFITGMFLARKLLASAHPIPFAGMTGAYESDRVVVPLTLGCLRPSILLPLEWRAWDPEKLDAVLSHERAHVSRRDGLVAALAGLNRCLFWFHPLAWMLQRKLALLAEQACDESSVAALGDRERYAHLLLEMALMVDNSHGRLRGHALTMAAGSHIRQRIESLLQEGRTFSRGLTWTGWAAVMLCGIPLVWGAGAVELDRQTPLPQLEMPRTVTPAPKLTPSQQKPPEPKPVLLAQAQAPAQPSSPAAPKFDVASIKPCNPGESGSRGGKSANGGGRGGGSRFSQTSPGRLLVSCMTVFELADISVQAANDDPLLFTDFVGPDPKRIRGGPAWVHSDRYTIEAESSDPVANGPTEGHGLPAQRIMRGPMLRSLLEDRFQLKTHREVEEIPMYALTVARSGIKIKPMEEGGCTPPDPSKGVRVGEMFPSGQKPLCISHIGWDGPNWTMDVAGESFSRLAGGLSSLLDRHVLDKTGITALYSFSLVFAHDDKAPGNFPADLPPPFPPSDIPPGPSVFTVLEQQLGLKLTPDKGPRAFLVIDSVERPSEN